MSVRVVHSTALACALPLETALSEMAQLGAREIDLLCIEGWAHLNPSELAEDFEGTVDRLRTSLDDFGLRIGCLNTMTGVPLHLRRAEDLAGRSKEAEALLRLMESLKISAAALQPPLRRGGAWSDAEQDAAIKSAREEVARAQGAGKTLALELHSDSPFSTPAQVDRLHEAWPDAPLVFDPSHFIAQGLPLAATEPWMETARLVHLRDAGPGRLQAPLGRGAIDFSWLLRTLRDYGFDGVISIEYLGVADAGFDVRDSARRLYDLVGEMFA